MKCDAFSLYSGLKRRKLYPECFLILVYDGMGVSGMLGINNTNHALTWMILRQNVNLRPSEYEAEARLNNI